MRCTNTMVLPSLLVSPLGGWPDWSPTARNFLTRPPTGTPRRAISPGEGLLRPRVARAQKIISLHPSLCSKHLLRGVAEVALYCAHRRSTIILLLLSLLVISSGMGPD